jgi:hypothetical protein
LSDFPLFWRRPPGGGGLLLKILEKSFEHFSANLSNFRWPVSLAFERRSR